MKLFTIILSCLLLICYSCKSKNNGQDQNGMNIRIELFTSDMEKSVHFYTTVLGFTMQGSKLNPSYQPVKQGNVTIGIGPLAKLSNDHHFNPDHKNVQKGYGAEIVLEVENVKRLYEKVKSSGYPIREPLVMQAWGLEDFRIVDSDGYYLRITSKQ